MRVVEKVRILSVEGQHALVEITEHDPSSCGSCPSSSSCGSGSGGQRTLRVQGLEGAEPGQELTVELELPSPAWAAFLLFMFPMAAAFVVGMIAHLVSGNAAAGFIGAGAGVVGAYTCVYFVGRGNMPRATPIDGNRGSA